MPPKPLWHMHKTSQHQYDARTDDMVVEVKFGVNALRTLRASLMQVTYAISENDRLHGYIVFVDFGISLDRFHDEWQRLGAVLLPTVLKRLTICLVKEGVMGGVPADAPQDIQKLLWQIIEAGRGKADVPHTDYSFVIPKLLIYYWLTSGVPMTVASLACAAGCSFLTAQRGLETLGSLVERNARKIRLRWFPEREWATLVATSTRARSTVRFAASSAEARDAYAHLRRLEKIAPPNLAIGGTRGAAHFFSSLDLVGAPRLDLSQHCPKERLDLSFIKKLDPALEQVHDLLQPATVVVHAVRHAEPMFTPREGGLFWADPVECALDLFEAQFTTQASQFLKYLQLNRPTK